VNYFPVGEGTIAIRRLQYPGASVSTGLQSQGLVDGAARSIQDPTARISTRLFPVERNAQAARPGDIFVEGFEAGVVIAPPCEGSIYYSRSLVHILKSNLSAKSLKSAQSSDLTQGSGFTVDKQALALEGSYPTKGFERKRQCRESDSIPAFKRNFRDPHGSREKGRKHASCLIRIRSASRDRLRCQIFLQFDG
jgi:hypothetical protein